MNQVQKLFELAKNGDSAAVREFGQAWLNELALIEAEREQGFATILLTGLRVVKPVYASPRGLLRHNSTILYIDDQPCIGGFGAIA